jgi:hypothetical protein
LFSRWNPAYPKMKVQFSFLFWAIIILWLYSKPV